MSSLCSATVSAGKMDDGRTRVLSDSPSYVVHNVCKVWIFGGTRDTKRYTHFLVK
jgi:hypothetical protein